MTFDEIEKFMIVFIALNIAKKEACLHLVQQPVIQFSCQQSIINYCAWSNLIIICKSFEILAETELFLKSVIKIKLLVTYLEKEDYQSQESIGSCRCHTD